MQIVNLRIGNGVGKQGIAPPIDDRKPDTEIQYRLPRCLQNQRVNSASSDSLLQRIKEKGRYGISVSTLHRRYGHRLRTPCFADPVSETPS